MLQLTKEHLGHFQVCAVVNKATSNIPVQILLWTSHLLPLGIVPVMKSLGHMVWIRLTLSAIATKALQSGWTNSILYCMYRVLYAPHPCRHSALLVFPIGPVPLWYVIVVLVYSPPKRTILSVFYTFCQLTKLWDSCPCFRCVVFLLQHRNSLYSVDTSPLSDLCIPSSWMDFSLSDLWW